MHRWEEEFATIHKREFALFVRLRDIREFAKSRVSEFEAYWMPKELEANAVDCATADRLYELIVELGKIPRAQMLRKTHVVDKATLDLLSWWRVTPYAARPVKFTLGQLPENFTVVSSNALGRALARLGFERTLVSATKTAAAYWTYSPGEEARMLAHDPAVVWPPVDV
jgi:hypothetical protein